MCKALTKDRVGCRHPERMFGFCTGHYTTYMALQQNFALEPLSYHGYDNKRPQVCDSCRLEKKGIYFFECKLGIGFFIAKICIGCYNKYPRFKDLRWKEKNDK